MACVHVTLLECAVPTRVSHIDQTPEFLNFSFDFWPALWQSQARGSWRLHPCRQTSNFRIPSAFLEDLQFGSFLRVFGMIQIYSLHVCNHQIHKWPLSFFRFPDNKHKPLRKKNTNTYSKYTALPKYNPDLNPIAIPLRFSWDQSTTSGYQKFLPTQAWYSGIHNDKVKRVSSCS